MSCVRKVLTSSCSGKWTVKNIRDLITGSLKEIEYLQINSWNPETTNNLGRRKKKENTVLKQINAGLNDLIKRIAMERVLQKLNFLWFPEMLWIQFPGCNRRWWPKSSNKAPGKRTLNRERPITIMSFFHIQPKSTSINF